MWNFFKRLFGFGKPKDDPAARCPYLNHHVPEKVDKDDIPSPIHGRTPRHVREAANHIQQTQHQEMLADIARKEADNQRRRAEQEANIAALREQARKTHQAIRKEAQVSVRPQTHSRRVQQTIDIWEEARQRDERDHEEHRRRIAEEAAIAREHRQLEVQIQQGSAELRKNDYENVTTYSPAHQSDPVRACPAPTTYYSNNNSSNYSTNNNSSCDSSNNNNNYNSSDSTSDNSSSWSD